VTPREQFSEALLALLRGLVAPLMAWAERAVSWLNQRLGGEA
jgi:hypothetical protein